MLKFRGCQHFRQRLIAATLAGRAIRIDEIRAREQSPGLQDFEACLLRLLEKLTNGCSVEINETGTTLRYRPGFTVGGSGYVHDCGKARSVGYYLEALVCLALFGQKPLSILLRGITNDSLDPTVDVWRTVTFPLLRKLGGEDALANLSIKVLKRGCPPLGGGEVMVQIPVLSSMPPVSLTEEGMVKRIRGVAFATRVSPQMCNRMVDGARGVLNSLLADVFIFTDHMTGPEAGLSPGFGLTLVAETTSGHLLSAEACIAMTNHDRETPQVPEAVGQQAAHSLLQEIRKGGVCDSAHQGLLLLLCALGPKEISQVRLGPLTPHAVRTLRHLRDILGVTFNVSPEEDSQTIFLSCIGGNIRNVSKKAS